MLLVGEGVTGKSRVIQTITEQFKRQGAAHTLIKSAFTGTSFKQREYKILLI
jgi:hypothetical protein